MPPSQKEIPLRYTPLSGYYQRLFDTKVYKVGVSVAKGCPAMGTNPCVFCDEYGSAAYPEGAHLSLAAQFQANALRVEARSKAKSFLVYFQAYTNTLGKPEKLDALLNEALALPRALGVVIGTRPDCLTAETLEVLAAHAKKQYVAVELGVQTLDDAQLAFLSRGHTAAESLDAIVRLVALPGVDTCAHLIFGIPGETPAQLMETASTLSALGVGGVKLHNLHVLKNTPLEATYKAGAFTPVTLEDYTQKVITFLEALSPEVAIHRLSAVASRWEDVLAPEWVKGKMASTQYILDALARQDTWQGRLYTPKGQNQAGKKGFPQKPPEATLR